MMLPAERTELFHFNSAGRGFLVLGARVVPVLAFAALERNDFSCHFLRFTLYP
jgi:hypothetical protein